MRWSGQAIGAENSAALPGLGSLSGLVRSVTTPEFAGMTFHEVLAKSALNQVPGTSSALPFSWTINPYRGCSHACTFCLSPETLILNGDGRQVPLWSVKVGDEIYGTESRGAYRRYVKTTVQAWWQTRKRAHRVQLADGTELVASADHRFLTERGWKYVTGAMSGPETRPFLTLNNRLMGFGSAGLTVEQEPRFADSDYQRGYLTGMIRGDGTIFHGRYEGPRGGGWSEIHAFRLALKDDEALSRSRYFLSQAGLATRLRPFRPKDGPHNAMNAIHTARRADVERIEELIAWPDDPSETWQTGYLAGLFDAEGSCSRGVLRIANKDDELLDRALEALQAIDIPGVIEGPRPNGVKNLRVTGGLPARSRFFARVGPAITRKLDIEGHAIKTVADLRVVAVEDLGFDTDMIDISTGTGDFIANGVVSHNCFARQTHTYLDLDAGKDFDAEIVVKVNVAEVLGRELARPSWGRHPVALGTNTDPYQRAEGRYRLMPGVIAALAASGTPFSILTKGTLLRRDIPLLLAAAERVPVELAMTIDVADPVLRASVEPGAPTTEARLATVKAVRDAGLPCSVFVMPVLPYLTDSTAHLDRLFAAIAETGAESVAYSALHLRTGAKEWFFAWLAREHPELLDRYGRMYPMRQAYAPKGYRQWLAKRVRPLLRRHGLERPPRLDPATGSPLPRVIGRARPAESTGDRMLAQELPAAAAAGLQPTLF